MRATTAAKICVHGYTRIYDQPGDSEESAMDLELSDDGCEDAGVLATGTHKMRCFYVESLCRTAQAPGPELAIPCAYQFRSHTILR